jgi:hypothetical protein
MQIFRRISSVRDTCALLLDQVSKFFVGRLGRSASPGDLNRLVSAGMRSWEASRPSLPSYRTASSIIGYTTNFSVSKVGRVRFYKRFSVD